MKYNAFFYYLFRGTMKNTIQEQYGPAYARELMKKTKAAYRALAAAAPDIGKDNPMAFNEEFALLFVAPYVASNRTLPPELIQNMMRRCLHHIRWYFSRRDLNTEKGKRAIQKSILNYVEWYGKEKGERYPTTFQIDFEGRPYDGACYYRITQCPICQYCRQLDVLELMPFLCDLDNLMVSFQHGILHRSQTIASGGAYCDYYITGDRDPVR